MPESQHNYGQIEHDRLEALEAIIQRGRSLVGQRTLDQSTLAETMLAWAEQLPRITADELWDCYHHAVRHRLNQGSALTVNNLLEAYGAVRNRRVDQHDPHAPNPYCQACSGNGYQIITVMRTPWWNEFANPITNREAKRCDCHGSVTRPDTTQQVSKMMRLLAGTWDENIPNPEREQRSAQRIAELGFDWNDVITFVDDTFGQNRFSYVTVLQQIGPWSCNWKSVKAHAKLSELGRLAVRAIENPMTESQFQRETLGRENERQTIQEQKIEDARLSAEEVDA